MEYRIYRRASSGSFDGVTAESATYKAARYLYTTDTDSQVGLFSAASLGRQNVASRVRVVADGVDPGDNYAVISPSGTTRETATLLTANSAWLLLYPDDELKVTSATARAIEIVVNDLDDAQFSEWAMTGQYESSARGYSEEVITAAGTQIADFSGEKTVFINLNAAGDVVLPPPANIQIGDKLHLIRVGGEDAALAPNSPTDQINGISSPPMENYRLRSDGEAVTYRRVSGGWQRRQGTNTAPALELNAGVTLGAGVEGLRNVLQAAAASANLDLPGLADEREGAGFVLVATGLADTQEVTPDGTDTINGVNASRRYFAGQPAILVGLGEGKGWAMVGGFDQGEPTALDLSVSTVLTAFSGTLHVNFAGVARQSLTLPAWAKCGRQSKIVLHNSGTNDVNVAPPGAELINRVNSAVPVVAGGRTVLYRDTSTATPNNWVSVNSA
ncbi:MAG: hypothetical protein KC486_31985 [Myxococcales bacterium]|nr:hypothetical protein [Myxococcales bacterium]